MYINSLVVVSILLFISACSILFLCIFSPRYLNNFVYSITFPSNYITLVMSILIFIFLFPKAIFQVFKFVCKSVSSFAIINSSEKVFSVISIYIFLDPTWNFLVLFFSSFITSSRTRLNSDELSSPPCLNPSLVMNCSECKFPVLP